MNSESSPNAFVLCYAKLSNGRVTHKQVIINNVPPSSPSSSSSMGGYSYTGGQLYQTLSQLIEGMGDRCRSTPPSSIYQKARTLAAIHTTGLAIVQPTDATSLFTSSTTTPSMSSSLSQTLSPSSSSPMVIPISSVLPPELPLSPAHPPTSSSTTHSGVATPQRHQHGEILIDSSTSTPAGGGSSGVAQRHVACSSFGCDFGQLMDRNTSDICYSCQTERARYRCSKVCYLMYMCTYCHVMCTVPSV
jgi:hypothetical protein